MSHHEIDNYYANLHNQIFGTGIVGWYWHRIYSHMRNRLQIDKTYKVLEVGAGSGQFYNNLNPGSALYIETELRESDEYEIAINSGDLELEGRIKRIANAEDLSVYNDNSFDEVLATCVLAHLTNPEIALKEFRRVARTGG